MAIISVITMMAFVSLIAPFALYITKMDSPRIAVLCRAPIMAGEQLGLRNELYA